MDNVDMGAPGEERSVIQAHAPIPGPEVASEAQAAYEAILADGVVSDDTNYVARAERLVWLKGKADRLTNTLESLLKPFTDGAKQLRGFFAVPTDWIAKAVQLEKNRLREYDAIKEGERKAAQETAFRQAEAERKRLEKLANKATARGDIDKAVELEGQALTTVAPIIERGTPKVAGAVYREVWTFQIEDEAKLPRAFLKPDEQKIRRQVQATRAETRIDGVRVFKDKQLAIRGS